MDSDILMLARDTWFSEMINIANNDDCRSIISLVVLSEKGLKLIKSSTYSQLSLLK